jgi:hypothetical protein
MIYLKNCKELIIKGHLLRVILTILALPFIKNQKSIIIIPIVLIILDSLDNVFIKYELIKTNNLHNGTNCNRINKYYKIYDKIIDILSYILYYVVFYDILNDELLEFFIFYRLIGIIIYTITKNENYIIIYFDFFKEYIVCKYLGIQNIYLLVLFMVCKVIYEYILHKIINQKP